MQPTLMCPVMRSTLTTKHVEVNWETAMKKKLGNPFVVSTSYIGGQRTVQQQYVQ